MQWGGERLFDASAKSFYENGQNSGTKVKKLPPRWEMTDLSEGYKGAVDQNWGRLAKIGFLDQKPRFWAQKKGPLSQIHHVLATTGKSFSKKKSAFSQIIKGGNIILGDFFGVKPIFRPKTTSP